MKPIRQQLEEALVWKSRFWSIRDFTLTVIAGFAIPFGVLLWMEGGSVRDPFDLKGAIGCFVLGGVCVLLASNKVCSGLRRDGPSRTDMVRCCHYSEPESSSVFALRTWRLGPSFSSWEHWRGHFGRLGHLAGASDRFGYSSMASTRNSFVSITPSSSLNHKLSNLEEDLSRIIPFFAAC